MSLKVSSPVVSDGFQLHEFEDGHSYDGWVNLGYVLNGQFVLLGTFKSNERLFQLASLDETTANSIGLDLVSGKIKVV